MRSRPIGPFANNGSQNFQQNQWSIDHIPSPHNPLMDTITITTEPSRFPKQRKPQPTMAMETEKRKSRRPTKAGRRSPAKSEAQKKLGRDPEHRRKMIAARHRSTEDRRKDPLRYSRLGVPTGMRKAEA